MSVGFVVTTISQSEGTYDRSVNIIAMLSSTDDNFPIRNNVEQITARGRGYVT